jgi:hypothetical protein
MRYMKKQILLWWLLVCIFVPSAAFSFSFSEQEEKEAQEEQQAQIKTQQKIDHLLSVPCQNQLKQKKIAVIIGQEDSRADYDLLFMEVNAKLQELGLKTYSQKEITAQIAQAEMDAFLSNDMDAAANAATKLKANFMLRGLIQSRTRVNKVVGINEVSISMVFTLIDNAGRIISNVTAHGESYSGQDTFMAALALVKEKSGLVVAQLYNDYCQSSGREKNNSFNQQAGSEPKVESLKDF